MFPQFLEGVAMFKTTYHRDGSVTLWNVYTQQWERTSKPSDHVLASLSYGERRRVCRHCGIEYSG